MNYDVHASQLIPDLSSDLISRAIRYLYNRYHLDKPKLSPAFVWLGLPVYHFGDSEFGYYVQYSKLEGQVAYFVRYRKINSGGLRFGRQVLVWADPLSGRTLGLSRHVFWNVLLPKYSSLIADTQQTKLGALFWRNRIGEAIEREIFCYAYDKRSTPNRLIPLNDLEDLDANRSILWGADEGHRRTHAVISLKPLKLSNT